MYVLESNRSDRPVAVITPNPAAAGEATAAAERIGRRCIRCVSMDDAMSRLPFLKPEIVVADVNIWTPESDAMLRKALQDQAVFLFIGDAEGASAAAFLRGGNADYLSHPYSREDLARRATALLARRSGVKEIRRPATDELIGRSEPFRRVVEQIELVAAHDATVLITGETGTGKERVARAIHAMSARASRSMVSVNCAGIPATLLEDEFFGHERGAFTDAHQSRVGRFEEADGSSVFLDEIGELPLELQPKLLRAIQEREVRRLGGSQTIRFDSRIIAATNVDLWAHVQEKAFREDLFYRVNVFPIRLPALRERREDIPLFVEHFLRKFCERDGAPQKGVSAATANELMARDWPGNIRELENAVEIAVIRSRDRLDVRVSDFPEVRKTAGRTDSSNSVLEAHDFKSLVSQFEREVIERALDRTNGNRSQAAEALGIKRTTLVEKLKRFDREEASFAAAV